MGNQQSVSNTLLEELPGGGKDCKIPTKVKVIPIFTVPDANNQLQLIHTGLEKKNGSVGGSVFDQSFVPFFFTFDKQEARSEGPSICALLSCFFTNIFELMYSDVSDENFKDCNKIQGTTFYKSLRSALDGTRQPLDNINVLTSSVSESASLSPSKKVRTKDKGLIEQMLRLLNIQMLGPIQNGEVLLFLTLRMHSLKEFNLFIAVITMIKTPAEKRESILKTLKKVPALACVKDEADTLSNVLKVLTTLKSQLPISKDQLEITQGFSITDTFLVHASDLWANNQYPKSLQTIYFKYLASMVLKSQLLWYNYLFRQQSGREDMQTILKFTFPEPLLSTIPAALFAEGSSTLLENKAIEKIITDLTKPTTFWQKVGNKKTQIAMATLAGGAAAALAGLGIVKRDSIKSGFQKFVKAVKNKVGFVTNKTSDVDGLLVQIDALVDELNCPEKEKEKVRRLVRNSRNHLVQASKVNTSLVDDIPAVDSLF
jgi:hypothetical protein